MFTPHRPQAEKQTNGYQCKTCGQLWDGHQVPCPIEVSLRSMEANRTCISCGGSDIYSVMPWRYEELKRGAVQAAQLEALQQSNG